MAPRSAGMTSKIMARTCQGSAASSRNELRALEICCKVLRLRATRADCGSPAKESASRLRELVWPKLQDPAVQRFRLGQWHRTAGGRVEFLSLQQKRRISYRYLISWFQFTILHRNAVDECSHVTFEVGQHSLAVVCFDHTVMWRDDGVLEPEWYWRRHGRWSVVHTRETRGPRTAYRQ